MGLAENEFDYYQIIYMSFVFSNTVIKYVLIFLCLPIIALAQEKTAENEALRQSAPPSYRIRQGDKLSVKFLYHPELNEPSIVVPPDGLINLQLVDDLSVIGLTVTEVKKKLDDFYAEILIKPIITVTLLEFVTPRIYIGGQINKPGRYDLRDGQTLVQVIFLAGGFTRDANKSLVIRARPDGKGDWQIQSANIMKILNKKGIQKDLVLQDGDFIFVPESKIAQINKAIQGFRGLLPRFF